MFNVMEHQIIPTAFGSGLYPLGYRVPGAEGTLTDLMATYPQAVVFDVRYKARSRWLPAWNKGALQKRWDQRYTHEKRFGNVNYRDSSKPIKLADPDTGVCAAIARLEWR